MKTYLVCRPAIPPSGTPEEIEVFNEKDLFLPLRELSETMVGKLTILTQLKRIGIATVEAEEEAVLALRALGYSVEENQMRRGPR